MSTDTACADMFNLSIEATTHLIQASSVASSGLALSYARSINLSLSIVAGMLCIFLGWKLYRDTVISKTSGDFSWGEFRIKLSASSPGIFMVLFGAWLIFSVVSQRVNFGMSQDETPVTKTSFRNTESIYGSASDSGMQRDLLLLTQSAQQPSQERSCAIRSSKFGVSGYGGSEGFVTSQDIEKTLGFAIATIRKDAAASMSTNPQFTQQEHASAVRILSQLRADVVRYSD